MLIWPKPFVILTTYVLFWTIKLTFAVKSLGIVILNVAISPTKISVALI